MFSSVKQDYEQLISQVNKHMKLLLINIFFKTFYIFLHSNSSIETF